MDSGMDADRGVHSECGRVHTGVGVSSSTPSYASVLTIIAHAIWVASDVGFSKGFFKEC